MSLLEDVKKFFKKVAKETLSENKNFNSFIKLNKDDIRELAKIIKKYNKEDKMENKIDFKIGDKVTFVDKESGYSFIDIVTHDNGYHSRYYNGELEILEVKRPKYEVIYEKKDLLTKEEKEFLKITNKIRIDGIKNICRRNRNLFIQGNNGYIVSYIVTDKFKGLELDKEYTLKELGLD